MSFKVGDHVYLKVSPLRGTKRFHVKGKLAPRYWTLSDYSENRESGLQVAAIGRAWRGTPRFPCILVAQMFASTGRDNSTRGSGSTGDARICWVSGENTGSGSERNPKDNYPILQGAMDQSHRMRSHLGEGIRPEGEVPSLFRTQVNLQSRERDSCEGGRL